MDSSGAASAHRTGLMCRSCRGRRARHWYTRAPQELYASAWYCHAKDNEALREGRRESHPFIVPLKQGKLDRGDPGEGREGFVMDG